MHSLSDAAALLGVSPQRIIALANRRFPPVGSGNPRRYTDVHIRQLRAWLSIVTEDSSPAQIQIAESIWRAIPVTLPGDVISISDSGTYVGPPEGLTLPKRWAVVYVP